MLVLVDVGQLVVGGEVVSLRPGVGRGEVALRDEQPGAHGVHGLHVG